MNKSIQMTRLALGQIIFFIALTASAANAATISGANPFRPSTAMESDVCVDCLMNLTQQPKPLLEHIAYFEDLKKIETLPRTPKGRGSAGELGLAGIGMVRLSVPGKVAYIGTGFLVSPCDVLTAYHVPFDADMDHPSSSVQVDFYYGQGNDDSFAGHSSASPVDHPESVGHGWGDWTEQSDTDKEDWALLRLKKCPGKEYSYLTLLPADLGQVANSARFETAGLLKGAKYANGIYREPSCQIVGFEQTNFLKNTLDEGMVENYCAAVPGSSGSPIIFRANGHPFVVAMSAEAYGEDPQAVKTGIRVQVKKHGPEINLAVAIRAIYPRLYALLTAEEKYVKEQTGEDWHFGEDARRAFESAEVQK